MTQINGFAEWTFDNRERLDSFYKDGRTADMSAEDFFALMVSHFILSCLRPGVDNPTRALINFQREFDGGGMSHGRY